MQAHGRAGRPVLNMFLGGLVKLAAVYILTGNPHIHILGTPIGTLLCYMCICALNIFSIRRLLSDPPALVKNLIRPFLAALIMGVLTRLSFLGLTAVGITSRLILCGAPIAVGVVVYCFMAVKLKVITRSDCMLLPKGAKIAKLLKL
jgi:stage V sporulation protein B